jgi:glutamate dehydrogenase
MDAELVEGDARTILDPAIGQGIAASLTNGALPGETDGLDETARADVAAFVTGAAAQRRSGEPAVRIESIGGEGVRRRMRLAIINDDMPFLVDSVAGALADHGIDIHRLLHPVVAVRRAGDGQLIELIRGEASGERRESMIYIEADRADAKARRALEAELTATLGDVRLAVEDWPRMQLALRDAATTLPDGEGAALLRWFLERHFTLLGTHVETRDGASRDGLGILRREGDPLWSDEGRAEAFRWFERGGDAPLAIKSDRSARVHRRSALDMLVVPVRGETGVEALSIHVGQWTSAALRSPSDKVPVLRSRLRAIEEKYGFDPAAHAGKALRHALSALPHDLLVGLAPAALEQVALTAMSLADRPRPKLVIAAGPLRRHLYAFVWLPREAVSTALRVSIRNLLSEAADAPVSSWSLETGGEGDLALLRFTLDPRPGAAAPDAPALDQAIEAMLRGWAPAVEMALGQTVNATRAARLTIDWAEQFPPAYRNAELPGEAAADILLLDTLGDETARGTRVAAAADGEPTRLKLKTYRLGGLMPLSSTVPVLENFGFTVLAERPTRMSDERQAYIHDFLVETSDAAVIDGVLARGEDVGAAISAVLEGQSEDDAFNALVVSIGLQPGDVLLLRAWFRYLRQTGLAYGLQTVAAALARSAHVTNDLLALFHARHDPNSTSDGSAELARIDEGLAAVASIEDDRILRRLRGLVLAILRTNAFTPAADEALAFKLDSAEVPNLPKPRPWREIWVYSPRVEGIHLRGGPIARGGLRWSDRRDDFRTEILGLMKAQVVKNAVIVPTGAKGGFYAKQLPPLTDRDAWLAEGTESYRIFIRTLLSVTDNLVEGAVVHPAGVTIRDSDDPYFVVAADKGTATFSDVANAIAVERGFWLGDAFASGGSVGYDHKAMGITAKGAWVSVQRHFAEMGVDVQADSVTVVGCGDMSGDVFGNGMLLSKTLRLVAAFDHRHIFLDPMPDPAASWAERTRMFALPRSSWADYDAGLISAGGGVFPRTQKSIPLSPEIRAVLGVTESTLDPSSLISAILKSPADLLWFGGIGTYVKAATEGNVEVGDAANDAHRVNGDELRVKVIGEGANLGVTQAGRIAFSEKGGRINTDFIDNSAGVDCSDNEVNIKIALNREMIEGRLPFEERNTFLASMTDEVARIVLEDNRLQTLGLSLAERGGAGALPGQVRVVEILEAMGRIDRSVDGIEPNEALFRRAREERGLTRPELAILLSHGKLALQAAIEATDIPGNAWFAPLLQAAFPPQMQARFADAIDAHRLRPEIVATKMANRVVNRLGLVGPFELSEEEGVTLAEVAAAYFAADALLGFEALFAEIEAVPMPELARLLLLDMAGRGARLHVADLLRASNGRIEPANTVNALKPGLDRLSDGLDSLLRDEAQTQAKALSARLIGAGGDEAVVGKIVRLFELDGAIGTASLGTRIGFDEIALTEAYVRLGEVLGIDWAKSAAVRFVATDPWERLLTAGLARDFEQLRLDFLSRFGGIDLASGLEAWFVDNEVRISQFVELVDRARRAPTVTAAMLAQIAAQARALLAR